MARTRNVLGAVGVVLLLCSFGWSDDMARSNVWSNLDVQFYGFVKADAAWSDSQIETGNYLKWAQSESYGNDSRFDMTARETRFGFKITGPELNGWQSRGQIEMDFYGGDTENKSNPMMRHAYLALTNPDTQLTILAGQTSDVVSPLYPHTLNYSVLWWIGNIGYRRPQIRVEKVCDLNDEVTLKTQVALARTLGTAGGSFASEPGADSGFPQIQGRVAVTMPCIGPKPATFGLSGHYGTEQHDITAMNAHVTVPTWSGNIDAKVPVCSAVTVKGELFTGSNLQALLGGIGQGVTRAGFSDAHGIRSAGGWIAAAITPDHGCMTTYNVGYGMEKVNEGDVASGDRTSNRCAFGNIIHSLNKSVDVGLELSYFKTTYLNDDSGQGLRVQGSFILKI